LAKHDSSVRTLPTNNRQVATVFLHGRGACCHSVLHPSRVGRLRLQPARHAVCRPGPTRQDRRRAGKRPQPRPQGNGCRPAGEGLTTALCDGAS
jgi:hypothetical protein